MCHQPLSDKGWLRQLRPNVTPDQIHDFTHRIGMKVDHHNPPPADLQKARMEAFIEMGFADVD